MVTPSDSVRICVIRGACSATERNSSPRSTPDAIACENCNSAADASELVAPEMIIALLMVSVMRPSS